jgi:SAM-dependent methyltransferase
MIRIAQHRVGSRVCLTDVDRLPFADRSIDSAYFVWVLHLVHDPATALAEAARVVRGGGRVASITSSSIHDDDDEIAPIIDRLAPLRQTRLDHNAIVVSDHAMLQLVHEGFTEWEEHETVPSAEADAIEQRIYSSLFDVDDATWERVVVPVIDALRALPEPDRPRRRRTRHPIMVWSVAAGH